MFCNHVHQNKLYICLGILPSPSMISSSPGLWWGPRSMTVCNVKPYVLRQWVMGEGRKGKCKAFGCFSALYTYTHKNKSQLFLSQIKVRNPILALHIWRTTFSSKHSSCTILKSTIESIPLYITFVRFLNNNQLKKLPSGIFSNNTQLWVL